MQRILDPAQIEGLTARSVPRLLAPDPARLYARRAARLRALAAQDSLGGYLGFAAAIAAAQHEAAAAIAPALPDPAALARAREHGMPPLPAQGLARGAEWRAALQCIVGELARSTAFPPAVAAVCARLRDAAPAALEAMATRLLAADGTDPDPAAAPFVAAALQVYWSALAARLDVAAFAPTAPSATCPACGSAPVASIVKSAAPSSGYRYLHCALCATEWHRVRVECTACGATQGVAYQSIEGGPAAIRAESCDGCRRYRKIFYAEHDPEVEPLADDLASIALDLLLADAGFARASANPLLWQPPG
ncbi:MAG: formate dehydrogenase accessory protein FdhE [Proteobacteria bacterium]|nr:formate dehydrogenase accessory protein FdhE [Pseudomonadota bacterium]